MGADWRRLPAATLECIAKRSRSATPAAEPQTEARRSCGTLRMPARDERAVCEAERVRSRGGRGLTSDPWNGAKPCVGHGGTAAS